MTVFADIAKQTLTPPMVITVPAKVWAQTWEERPKVDTKAGLRIVSDAEVQAAQHLARKFANELHHGDRDRDRELWVMAYEDALMRHLVSRALCDATDISKSYGPIRIAPEDMMASKDFIQSDGVRYLFDSYEALRIVMDPTQRPIEDSEVWDLCDAFEERIDTLPSVKAARVRRLLSFCLSELSE